MTESKSKIFRKWVLVYKDHVKKFSFCPHKSCQSTTCRTIYVLMLLNKICAKFQGTYCGQLLHYVIGAAKLSKQISKSTVFIILRFWGGNNWISVSVTSAHVSNYNDLVRGETPFVGNWKQNISTHYLQPGLFIWCLAGQKFPGWAKDIQTWTIFQQNKHCQTDGLTWM